MKALAISLVASAALCFASPASAMPVANLAPVASNLALHQSVPWVCGPFRCWWRPWGYYRPWAYYRPYPPPGYYRPYGFYGYGYGYGPQVGGYGGQGGYGYGPQVGGYGGQGNTTKEPLSTGK